MREFRDFPGGPVVKKGTKLNFWPGKIPHAAGQLSLHSRAHEPALLKPGASATREATAVEKPTPTATGESPSAATKT